MKVQDIVIHDVGVFPDNGSLRKAAVLMREKQADVLLVQQQGERTVGTLSYRDLALKGYAEGRDPDKDSVAMVMSQHIASCPLETDLIAAMRLMTEEDVDTLVVHEPPEQVIGLVTRTRVLEELAQPSKESRGPTPESVKRVRGAPV